MDGYSSRILTAQGDAAPGGAPSYVANGKLTGGFAILATPVNYAETGIVTFTVGPNATLRAGLRAGFGKDRWLHQDALPQSRLVTG